jgi:Eco57I restriction-modification methylase/TaqI-like C-terminal specificity domain
MSDMTQLTLFDSFNTRVFPLSDAIAHAIEELATNSEIDARGAVFTRIEVVDFILDLVGYHSDKPLFRFRILEPSFGDGDFLFSIVSRLLKSWKENSLHVEVEELEGCLRAVELHKETYDKTRRALIQRLICENIPKLQADKLVDSWLIQGDYLLEEQKKRFDFIVGNPPYVRQELIPDSLLGEYRRRFKTIYDRADLYIPFLENSLSLLKDKGVLGFICTDRWMKNRYGGPLRKFVSEGFCLKAFIDMVNTDAFHSKVSAYPAITVIGREKSKKTRIAHSPKIEREILSSISNDYLSITLPETSLVKEVVNVVNGSEPWLLESTDQIALLRRIEKQYPSLEETGCKVGIGVATGADKAFIADYKTLDVEDRCKLPLVRPQDIQTGEVIWRGEGVVNPFEDDGKLVDLDKYPRLAKHIERYKSIIRGRHCAKKSPSNWFRTIDRIWPDLVQKPKLLIPDIKGEAHVVFEEGKYYPHHNLYFVVSDSWDLRALQAVLLSTVSKLFISTYSTKMRGGYLRFQAQYIRRIRLPYWRDVSDETRHELIRAAKIRNIDACNQVVFKLYKLSQEEKAALGGNGD